MQNNNNTTDLDITSILDVSDVPGANPGLPGDFPIQQVVEDIKLREVKSNPSDSRIDLLADYVLVRKSMINRSEIGMDLLQETINIARQTENPKYITAAVELMKEIGAVDRDIIKFHENIEKIKNNGKPSDESQFKQEVAVQVFTDDSPNSLLEEHMKEEEEIQDAEFTEV